MMKERPFYGVPSLEASCYEAPHRAVSQKAASEGIVLLKNECRLLPLAMNTSIALYGAGATHMVKGGTGSGDVNEREVVNVYQGLVNAGYKITNEAWLAEYGRIYSQARLTWKENILAQAKENGGDGMAFFLAYTANPFIFPEGPDIEKTEAHIAIYVLSRISGEGADRSAKGGDYYLTEKERQDIHQISKYYANVILVVNSGGLVDLSIEDECTNIRSILYMVQPGMEGGNALADVISGKVTPSGKLTDTWAYRYEDYPNSKTFSHNDGNVEKERYEEGIYAGYRYFDSFAVPVRYSFGYGLSYTSFQIKTEWVNIVGADIVEVTAKVTNTGRKYSGKEVVQVYVSAPSGALEKEYRRLCGFAKTGLLAPGESEVATIQFSVSGMSSYNEGTAEWILEEGLYGLWIGNSLEGSQIEVLLSLSEKKVLQKVKNICPLQERLTEFSLPAVKRESRHLADIQEAQDREVPAVPLDLTAVATDIVDYDSSYEPDGDEAARIVNGLTLEQMILLSTGVVGGDSGSNLGSAGVSVPGSAGETSSAAMEYGIPNIVLADGPAGLRLNQEYFVTDGKIQLPPSEAGLEHGFFYEPDETNQKGTKYYQFCTSIPVGTLLAQSWNENLIEEVGRMVAEEMKLFGVTLWLAPGMNTHRNPLCGRNFEYYSEDPLVSGKIAAAMVRGVQSVPGCGTTIKHFACNNQEDNRMGSDSILSERVLREIYLKGFEIAVKESKPMSIMTSYNLINGVHTANSRDLCTIVARQEWGFDGLIMTDWLTTANRTDCTAAGCMRAGNDLVMPGQVSDHENIRQELEQGTLKEEDIRKCVTRLVRIVLRSDFYEEE